MGGKCLSSRSRNFLATLVSTVVENGGLNNVIFLVLLRPRLPSRCGWSSPGGGAGGDLSTKFKDGVWCNHSFPVHLRSKMLLH